MRTSRGIGFGLVCILLIASLTGANAQFKSGIHFGVHTPYFLQPDLIFTTEEGAKYHLEVLRGPKGLQLGVWLSLQFASIYLQGQGTLNNTRYRYLLTDVNGQLFEKYFEEEYQHFSIPIKLGWDWGWLSTYVGVTGNYLLNHLSDLRELPFFDEEWKEFQWALNGGCMVEIWRLKLEIGVEQGLGAWKEHVIIDGQPYKLLDRPGRVIASLYIVL